MKLRVGDGARFAVVAIGMCILSLPLDLILAPCLFQGK